MTKQYRACLSAWIIFGTLSLLSWSIVWVNWGHASILKNAAIPLIVSGAVIVWLTGYRITITPTELFYRNSFGTQSIRHDQIKKVRLKRVPNTRGPPSPQLIVEPRPGSGAKEMSINVKVFPKAAVIAVLDLGKQVAEADDGGLLDGIVVKTLREHKKNERR